MRTKITTVAIGKRRAAFERDRLQAIRKAKAAKLLRFGKIKIDDSALELYAREIELAEASGAPRARTLGTRTRTARRASVIDSLREALLHQPETPKAVEFDSLRHGIALRHGVDPAEITPEFIQAARAKSAPALRRYLSERAAEAGVSLRKDTPELREEIRQRALQIIQKSSSSPA